MSGDGGKMGHGKEEEEGKGREGDLKIVMAHLLPLSHLKSEMGGGHIHVTVTAAGPLTCHLLIFDAAQSTRLCINKQCGVNERSIPYQSRPPFLDGLESGTLRCKPGHPGKTDRLDSLYY